MAVQITHIRSNQNRTQFERTRILFDFVRATFASPRTTRTDLSRRLRDGVSLENELVSSRTVHAAPNLHQSWIACRSRLAYEKRVHYQRFHAKLTL
jgi:hypothetical protein